MPYLHVDINIQQTAKRPGAPCGDVVRSIRTASATTLILADGLGSGINANIAATMCVSRFMELLESGFPVRKAFNSLVKTMNKARGNHMSYAAFTVVHILNKGVTTILTYETPAPLFLNNRSSYVLPHRTELMDKAIVGESECYLEAGDGLMLLGDGITQAGMGLGLPNGWTEEGVSRFCNDQIAHTRSIKNLAELVLERALEHWGASHGDDCTVAQLSCRKGRGVNIFTGPPGNPYKDAKAVAEFMRSDGIKIVCGATTAHIIAKHTNKELRVERDSESVLAPPMYLIDGIDLVTEGAVTLNQLYNIFDEDASEFGEISGVTELYDYLKIADRVHIRLGLAVNPASLDIAFRQKGILSRRKIVSLLEEKLKAHQKLVVVDYL